MIITITICVVAIVAFIAVALVHGGSDGPDPYDGEGW